MKQINIKRIVHNNKALLGHHNMTRFGMLKMRNPCIKIDHCINPLSLKILFIKPTIAKGTSLHEWKKASIAFINIEAEKQLSTM